MPCAPLFKLTLVARSSLVPHFFPSFSFFLLFLSFFLFFFSLIQTFLSRLLASLRTSFRNISSSSALGPCTCIDAFELKLLIERQRYVSDRFTYSISFLHCLYRIAYSRHAVCRVSKCRLDSIWAFHFARRCKPSSKPSICSFVDLYGKKKRVRNSFQTLLFQCIHRPSILSFYPLSSTFHRSFDQYASSRCSQKSSKYHPLCAQLLLSSFLQQTTIYIYFFLNITSRAFSSETLNITNRICYDRIELSFVITTWLPRYFEIRATARETCHIRRKLSPNPIQLFGWALLSSYWSNVWYS